MNLAIVVPQAVESIVFDMAKKTVKHENLSRRELLSGKSLREVNNKYKAL
jgi:regulator of RNase E activity RraA